MRNTGGSGDNGTKKKIFGNTGGNGDNKTKKNLQKAIPRAAAVCELTLRLSSTYNRTTLKDIRPVLIIEPVLIIGS